jgi:Ornithine carbamoyltransferase
MTDASDLPALQGSDFLSLGEWDATQFRALLEGAIDLKRRWRAGDRPRLLQDATLAMIFEKQSLRTRSTFDIAMYQLGGHSVLLSQNFIGVGVRESTRDVAKNLERWVDGIMARTYGHQTLLELAEHADVPVINGLSDLLHPCH